MTKYKFEDIALNITTKKKPVEEDKHTYLGLEHLDPETLIVSRFGSEVAPIGDKIIMKKGDVLFGKRRAYQKKVAIAPFDGIFSAHGMVLRPKTDVIEPELFPLFISSDYFLDTAIKISVGSLSPTINWRDLKIIEFNVPNKADQLEIATLLWSVVNTIESYRDLIKKTNEMVKSEFHEFIKNKTKKCKLSDYCDLEILNARTNIGDKDEIKYIEISSIDSDLNLIVNPTDVLFESAPVSARYILKPNDVLVSLVRPNLKKIAINKINTENVVGTSGFCVLRPKEGISPYFLQACVLSDEFTNKMISLQTGSTYPTIKNNDVLNYKVPLLTETELKEISKILKAGYLSQLKITNTLDELQALYKKISFGIFNDKEE